MGNYDNWRKSTKSGSATPDCVEVAFGHDGAVGLRDTKDRSGPILEFTADEWVSFLGRVQSGAFAPDAV
ncbi:DUF397 domain-containing protein [Longispora sp. NPDC051575]|uniref:DUF397 domain-containing protein n=1 Tax=Longispora sp. NPDC051575 TaxID=3154943 RepID=UPI003449D662